MSVPEAGEGAMFWSHYQPSVEIVEEFKLQTNGFSAQYGSNGGSVLNIITKSGTNQIHGTGYYFGQWTALNANGYFANEFGQSIPEYHRHQFGGTVGGPIVKNNCFTSSTTTGPSYNAPSTLTTTVPTALQKQGDFSQTYNADGSLQQIFDPFSAVAESTPRASLILSALHSQVTESQPASPIRSARRYSHSILSLRVRAIR